MGAPPPLPSSSPCSCAFPLPCPLRSCLGLQLEVAAAGKGGVDARFAEGGEERETDASAVVSVWMGGEREDAVRRENTWICGAWGPAPFLRDRICTPLQSATVAARCTSALFSKCATRLGIYWKQPYGKVVSVRRDLQRQRIPSRALRTA